jgi:anaerobic magnesium-protoporphyrin IX monomethyl ester cyclase
MNAHIEITDQQSGAAVQRRKRRVLLVGLTQLRPLGNAGNYQDYPYGLLSIATYCKDIADFEILDLAIRGNDTVTFQDELRAKLTGERFDVIGISVMFDNAYRYVAPTARIARDMMPESLLLLGGAAIYPAAEKVLKLQQDIDAIGYSEAEVFFRDLLLAADMKQEIESHNSWVSRASIKHGMRPEKNVLMDLNKVVDVDYSLVDAASYSPISSYYPTLDLHVENSVQFPLITSRGCPFKCTFCWHSGENDTSMRYASVDRIVDHLEHLVQTYGLTTVSIYDDQILLNRGRAKEFFRKVARLNLRIELPNGVTVSYLDDELAELMYKGGVRAIRLAIESGDPYVLRHIINKPMRLDRVKPVVESLRKFNIWIFGFFVIGMPGETDEHRRNTVNFIRDVGIDWCSVSIASPTKGSLLYQECLENGYIEEKEDFLESGYLIDENVISTPQYSAEYISQAAYDVNLEVNFVSNYRMSIGDYMHASLYFQYLVRTYPDHAFAHFYLAKCLVHLGKPESAEKHMNIARKLKGEDPRWAGSFERFNLLDELEMLAA